VACKPLKLRMAELVASELYPIVRRFLLESGLSRTLKAFDKDTSAGEDAACTGSTKRSRKLGKQELSAVCQFWLASAHATITGAAASKTEPELEVESLRPKKRKRVVQEMLEEAKPPAIVAVTEVATTIEEAAPAQSVPKETKKKKHAGDKEIKSGVPFRRVDDDKWRSKIKDERLLDNTHNAKNKFGGSAGDSWGDSAAGDMLKVKGKGFRKEMAKKKRSSWRGCGELDQGVNSIKFSDSEGE